MLTEKQEHVLRILKQFQAENGYPPTIRELGDLLGQSSTAGVHKILQVLISKGVINKSDKGKSRAIHFAEELHQPSDRARSYPVLGQVVAGEPQLAYEDKEGEIILDAEWAGKGDVFILRVKGHSMIDADIHDGDLLVVEKTASCHNGEIVVALLDDEATVKRFFKERDRIRLQPENPSMQPIYVQKDDPNFRIIGKVRGLMRRF